MFEHTKDRDGMHDHTICSSARRCHADDLYVSPANGCILTLKLDEEPEEHEKRSWEAPADFRNKNDAKVAVVQLAFEQGAIEFLRFRGVPPPEGYKVELPAPRESKKAKRKGTDGAGTEGEGVKKKTRLLSQTEQFRAANLPPKPREARAVLPPRPATSGAAAILLPRPGYIDPKPEPGELPAEAPQHEPEQQPSQKTLPPPSAAQPSRQQPLEYPPRRTPEPSSYDRFQGHPRPTAYDTREHGHQYELGDSWYDDSGAYASDPYYAPPQASYTEPPHAPSFVPAYPEEDGYSRSYYDVDYGHDYDRSYGFDYGYGDYDYERDHHAVPPPPSGPGPASAHGYADFEHSGYDDYGFAHEHHYTHARGHTQHPPGPWQDPAPRSPPRVWEPGPRAGKVDARRGGAARRSRPPPELMPRASVAAAEVQPGPVRGSAASSSSSPSSTPAGSLRITRTTAPLEPASELAAKPAPSPSSSGVSIKDELFGTFEGGHFLVAPPHPS
jgi:hypothetical protein